MPVLSTNRLLTWLVGVLAFYWSFGLIIDGKFLSVLVSASVFVGSSLFFVRSLHDAIAIVRKDQIGPGELAVIGVTLISGGATWSGFGNVLYATAGRPEEWIGAALAFGRFMMAVGFCILFLAPDATRHTVRWPRWWIMVLVVVVVLSVGILIGHSLPSGGELTFR